MLKAKVVVLCCLTVVGLVACASEEGGVVDEGTKVVERTVTRTVTAPGETTQAPAPEPTTEEPEEPASEPDATDTGGQDGSQASTDLVVGDAAVTASGNEITIHSFEYVPADEFYQPEPGFRFAAVDVEGCADPDSATAADLNPYDFNLQMPDNTRLDGDYYVREPVLNATTILPGDCVRGWVTYQVPEGTTPANVIFTGSSIVKWAVQDIAAEDQAPEEVLTQQYEYINIGDYDAAYALFSDPSQQAVSLEQYRAFFQSYDYYFVESYSFPSVQVQGETATVEVALTNSTSDGEEAYQATQELVREDGGWRVVMRDAQVATFAGSG